MAITRYCLYFYVAFILCSCAATNNAYDPTKKYPKARLQNDFKLLQKILEAKHPSLYWYTDKSRMNAYFQKYYADIGDSMTEQQFAWHVISPLIQKIHCGHTSVSMSRAYGKWVKGKAIPAFPLYMKVWNDTMAVTGNLNYKKDSIFNRGTLVTSINDIPNHLLIKYMKEFLPEDGYAENVNYIRLSANFPYFHRNIFGLSKSYQVTYLDGAGREQKAILPLFVPAKDSLRKDSIIRKEKKHEPVEKKILQDRSLTYDSSGAYAVLTVNTFAEGHLRSFFRRSFKELKRKKISNLVIDVRSNGGGRVGMSTLLTKYVSKNGFRVADSLYSPHRGLGAYTKYIRGSILNNIEMFFISRKRKDGNYHIRRLEDHYYNPKKNAFDGRVYVLTNGPTFSAAALFCNAVKGQKDITLVGEETGGGWYGNNGIMIPDITLPQTKIRVRLPIFRLVQFEHPIVKGSGIPPDIYIGTSYDALINGYDKKMTEVRKMILGN